MAKTLYHKHIDSHTIARLDDDGHVLLYIDRQVLNEYTSPQAFSGLRQAGRKVARPQAQLTVVDHVNPTTPNRIALVTDNQAARQISYLAENCRDFGLEHLDILDVHQGIEHVVAPELGFILPGMVVAAGDSHTTTYGALGAFGFGIGTSQIEHLLATQTLVYKQLKTMRVTLSGALRPWVSAKDIIMALVAKIGADGATGYAIEFAGSTVKDISVEGRMTICNMAVEAGARGAFMAPDDKVFAYLKDKPHAPKGELWDQALAQWQQLYSDPGAHFDQEVALDVGALAPMVSWGTSPDQATTIGGAVPNDADAQHRRALDYMALSPAQALSGLAISHAFIGSCTNARIEDLRLAAQVAKGRKVAKGVRALVVPGSSAVRRQAEAEGLAQTLIEAGFEWRQSGCSMCLAMNDDVLGPGDRCASSTNRNFEGRQGAGARTHLMSPAMVAAAAVTGALVDVRTLMEESV